MTAVASVTVDTSGLKRIAGELDPRAQKIIAKTALDVEDRAKRGAPVDTGALRASIYSAGAGLRSKYLVSQIIARGLNPDAAFHAKEDGGDLTAIVGASVEYAIYQEFGTKAMKAHPFMIPALEAMRKPFLDAWKEMTK